MAGDICFQGQQSYYISNVWFSLKDGLHDCMMICNKFYDMISEKAELKIYEVTNIESMLNV